MHIYIYMCVCMHMYTHGTNWLWFGWRTSKLQWGESGQSTGFWYHLFRSNPHWDSAGQTNEEVVGRGSFSLHIIHESSKVFRFPTGSYLFERNTDRFAAKQTWGCMTKNVDRKQWSIAETNDQQKPLAAWDSKIPTNVWLTERLLGATWGGMLRGNSSSLSHTLLDLSTAWSKKLRQYGNTLLFCFFLFFPLKNWTVQ